MGFPDLIAKYGVHGLQERGQLGSALTGEIPAALAAGQALVTVRYPATALAKLYVQRIHVQYTTGVAFTTPVTLGRHLRLYRGAPTSAAAGASNPAGGSAFTFVRKRSDVTTETLAIGRVHTGASAITTTGFTFESAVMQRMLLAHVGAAGSAYDEVWRFDGVEADPVVLLPGEVLAIAAGATFDAAGTFAVQADIDCVEWG